MSRKSLMLTSFVVLAMLAALIPLQVRAGGACGGAYTVESGDTIAKLAAMCGTTTDAIYASNPGIKEPLTVGQVITIPGSNYGVTTTPVVVVTAFPPATTPVIVNNYNTYNYYNYYNYYPTTSYNGTYVVQPGDSFSGIAYRHGVTIQDLWAANPYIWDINLLYVGQVLYIPSSTWAVVYYPTATAAPEFLSYDPVPKSAPHGKVALSNQSDTEVYVSLQCTTASGVYSINEYTVNGKLSASVPTGWCDYVAWVGGVKHTGGFKVGNDTDRTMTFYKKSIVVE